MSTIGILLMWVWLAIAFKFIYAWPMGKESDRREKYWARFEGK